jgi:peptidoglycan/LPS O-acetylase OafA/YrhL
MTTSLTSNNSERLKWLQVGRFLAAFWVLLHHGEGQLFNGAFGIGVSWKTYGLLGVDFFFCLSGFIIIFQCWSSFGNPESAGRFLQRRIVRIYPLIWLVMLAQILASITIGNTSTPTDWATLTCDALLLPAKQEHTINVAWSLRHEMFFYGITAVIMLFKPKSALCLTCAWFIGILLTSFWKTHDSNLIGKFLFSSWNILFLTGVFVAFAFQNVHKKAANWLAVGFLLFICGLLFLISGSYPSHHTPEDLPRMISSAIMFGGVLTFLIGLDLKGIQPPWILVLLGDASYSIYIVHSTVLYHLRAHLNGFGLQIASIIAIPIILGISVLTYRYFERPSAQFFRKLFFETRPTSGS